MLRTCCYLLLTLTLLLTGSRMALAAAVTVTPSGNGIFIINGTGMDAVAGVDLSVSYDAASLSSPTVTQGSLISGALMAVNTTNPGSIKIAAVSTRPFPVNGQIATITFATHNGTGRISVISRMINSKGTPVPGGGDEVAFDSQPATGTSSGLITSAGAPFSPPTTTTNSGTAGTLSTTTSQTSADGPVLLSTVSMPGDVQPKSDPKPSETVAPPIPAAEPAPVPSEPQQEVTPAPTPQKTEPVKMTYIKGTVENFSTFQGEKNPANFIALLNKPNSAFISQQPAFALSDGKSTLKVIAEIKSVADKSPNFALHGAKLVSLTRDEASFTWIVETLPQAGVTQASLTILTDSEIIEYPLTLAPLVEGISPLEADFVTFLKDSGAPAPKNDLNGDGKHDYLDDFIYTVNYLSKKGAAVKAAQ